MPTYFVTGASGTQGGAVALSLLSLGHKVHALVRDLTSPEALAIQSAGAVLFPGSFQDVPSMLIAATDCEGVFMNVTPNIADPSEELNNAKNIIKASREADIKHIVYTSVLNTGQHKLFPDWDPNSWMAYYWTSKNAIEVEVRSSGFEFWTILRPGTFMTNLLPPLSDFMYPELWTERVFRTGFEDTTTQSLIDPADIGHVVAKVFGDGGKWSGLEIDLFCEELTVTEVVDVLIEVTGKSIKVVQIGETEVKEGFLGLILLSQRFMSKLKKLDIFKPDQTLLNSTGLSLRGFKAFLEDKKRSGKLQV